MCRYATKLVAIWSVMHSISGAAFATDQETARPATSPQRPAAKFEVDFRVQVSPDLDKQRVLVWINLLKELGASGVSQIPLTPPGSNDNEESPFQPGGPRRVTVTAMLGPAGNLFIGADGYKLADRAKLAALIKSLQADGMPTPDAGSPMWGLGRAQLELLQADLKAPSHFEFKDTPFASFLNDLRNRIKLDIRMSPEAQAQVGNLKLNAVTGEVSLGCALAYVLGQHGLAWEPRQSSGNSVAIQIMPRELSKRPWPVGLTPEQMPGNIAPNLMANARFQTNNTPLNEVLEALRSKLAMDVLLDRKGLMEHDLNPDRMVSSVQIPSGTFLSAIRKILAPMGLKHELRIDEANRAFLWVTLGEPTGPVKKK